MRAWRLNLAASALAFGTYFCMYAFRKPFAAATYPGEPWFGLDPKTVLVISQALGYTVSKYAGIKWIAEVPRARRLTLVVGLVAAAEVALLGFALVPPAARAPCLFLNGLPLGMIWGLMVRYLEGRRTSELMLAGLSCSFIVASGVVKDVGRLLLDRGIADHWMPASVGLMFFAPLCWMAWRLDRLPDPSREDEAEREPRRPMYARERRQFAREHAVGLLLLLGVYAVLTAFRDFRDNYGIEIFAELGYAGEPAIFSQTELPVALLVLSLLSVLSAFRDRMRGLVAVFAVTVLGMALLGLGTAALEAGAISGQAWMICVGLGAYLTYVPFSSFLFDRIMAATRVAGTAVFAVNLADAIGYTGSVGMQLHKDLLASESSRLAFFKSLSYGLSLGGTLLLTLAGIYFWRAGRRARSAAAASP